jgi:PAB1-binding protein PBP1
MMEAGPVPIEKAQELLENPDIDAYTRRAFAARKLIDNMLDEAMSKGRRTSDLVSRYMDLQYSRKQAWLAYNEAIFIKAPQDHIDAIEEICGAIETTIKQLAAEEAEEAAAQAAAMAPPPMPMPPGPMMPPPTGEPMPMPTPALPPLPGVGAAA